MSPNAVSDICSARFLGLFVHLARCGIWLGIGGSLSPNYVALLFLAQGSHLLFPR